MSTNFLNWKKLDMIECGQYYSINLDTNEIRNDNSLKILKPRLTKSGYYQVCLFFNGKQKWYYVHVLVYIAHYGICDTNIYEVDHIDHCRTNNNISNLRLVSKSLNAINISCKNGKHFDYQSELPDAITINEECNVYFCKQFDKFYRKVSDNQFRELREYNRKDSNGTFIRWHLNKKQYTFTTSNYRDLI